MRRSALIGLGTLAVIAACMLAPASGMRGVGHPLLLAASVVAIIFLAALSREAWRHQRLAAGLGRIGRPATIDGQSVALVPGLGGALVAGLRRPRIFFGDDLPNSLDVEELRAVVLHEHHHQVAAGPARLVLIGALSPLLDRVEAGRAWIERERARIEIAADAYALASGASRPALASALVKLASSRRPSLAPGFASAADLRIRALLGEGIDFDGSRSAEQIAGAIVLIASCLTLYLT